MTNEGFVVVSLAPISDFTFHTYLHTSYVFNNYFFHYLINDRNLL